MSAAAATRHAVAVKIGERTAVAVREREARGVAVGLQGPPGVDGADARFISLVAGAVLSGQRAITTDADGKAVYCDNLTPSHAGKLVGISRHAALVGADLDVQLIGVLQDSSFSFVPRGLVYCGAAGVLTQTPPASGFSNIVGYALTADTLFVYERSIILAEV